MKINEIDCIYITKQGICKLTRKNTSKCIILKHFTTCLVKKPIGYRKGEHK